MQRLTPALAALLAALVVLAVGALSQRAATQGLVPALPHAVPTLDTSGVSFVTSAACASCHEAEHAAWQGSHHRHALEHASAASVRGDFADASFTRDGETLLFHRDGERFLVRARGPDGEPADQELRFTFGWAPLQQYLVALPDGRLQALDVAWDNDRGRWIDLYPDEASSPGDPLHWSGAQQNWNFMCADCHSTGLARGYDPANDSFATTWAEETVGCESCHGAGGAHLAWAEGKPLPAGVDPATKGLAVSFARGDAVWSYAPGAPIAQLSGADASIEPALCGTCHAHRRLLGDGRPSEAPLLTDYLPSLLDEGLYHADGRQQAEVYILGSFLQSKMAAAGVTCSDCHDPHAATLKAEGNGLCAQCHEPAVFDRPEHHHHAPETAGAACVSCHMPEDLYMQVDGRRDHGFRVPGAALAALPGVVDGCAACHEQAAAWSAAQAAGWWPEGDAAALARTEALVLGRAQAVGAADALAALAADPAQPPIFRATALSLLGRGLRPSLLTSLQAALHASDPLLRLGAVRGLAALPLAERYRTLAPLIGDPAKGVRLEVAAALSEVPLARLPPAEAAPLAALFAEMLAVERLFLDRPESHYNIANHLARQGETARAEQAYRAALERDPGFVPAYVNLAELQRGAGSESLALATLRRGLAVAPDSPELHYALGLALHRGGDQAGALAALGEAWRLPGSGAAQAYGYALALAGAGRGSEAVEVLRAALVASPNDRDLLTALVHYLALAGEVEEARRLARHLVALEPENPQLQDLLRRLGG